MYQVPESIKTILADMAKAAPATNTREWTVKQPHVSVQVSIEHEHISPDGCFSDPRDVAWVKKQIAKDNLYAWCMVLVRVEYYYWDDEADEQVTVYGVDSLGGVSYKNKADMKPLLDEMVANALIDLKTDPKVAEQGY